MYFPNAFRKNFLPTSTGTTGAVSTATYATNPITVVLLTSITSITAGMPVVGTGIPAGTYVTSAASLKITLSNNITSVIAAASTITVGGTTYTVGAEDVLPPNVLKFSASLAGVVGGMTVTASGIPTGTTVVSTTATTVTLSNNVTSTIATSTSITFGASGVSVLTSGSTASLTAGQIGFFQTDGQASQAASAKPFIIAQGSYFNSDKISPALGGYQESVKSKVVNPRYISRLIKVSAKQARQMVVQVPVTCGLTADTTYRLRVDIKGSPALRFLSHNMYRTLDSYSGCASTVDPTLLKDPVATLLNWADQINLSPIFNTMVQARVYKLSYNATGSTTSGSITTTSAVLSNSNFTTGNGVAIGQKVVGSTIPANSFVTAITSGTSVTITYPAQQTAPSIGTIATLGIKFYNDLYSGAIGTPQLGAATYIAGTGSQTGVGGSAIISNGVATNETIDVAGSNGASIYSASADASTFTVDAHIELSAAYIETKFGICTFTPTDKYDLEPLLIYTSIVDETGDPCNVYCFTTTNSNTGVNTTANDNTVVQYPIQAFGLGETVLRDFILSDRYLQLAYPDSNRVESLRMREIEQNPALLTISRTGLYDQVLVLHNVPRFNNPSGTFDNDQYLLCFYVPTGTSTTALTNYIINSVSAAGGTISLETTY